MKTYRSKLLDKFFEVNDKLEYQKVVSKMLIAKRISEGMQKQKIGKRELAINMKISPSVITKWLSGTHNFTIDTLIEIENELKIRLIN